ncbi:hypothetical protein [Acinetobacter soli]|uniref:hypothetical protein n=1 Tax=Acinetobacter soli TaxID=487316 RepID=UPI00124FC062|nr:hypothetical protein [Acinetobacter soli]
MRELSISEYNLINGGITETQCVGISSIAGGVIGGVTGGVPGALVGATVGSIVGGVFCAPITGSNYTNNNNSEDGDG